MNNLGEETCICCGLGIPEGRQVCPACEREVFKSPLTASFNCWWCGCKNKEVIQAFNGGVYTRCGACGKVIYYKKGMVEG